MNDSHLDEHRQFLPANRYASTVVFNILDRVLTIDSVLDLGCGIGVWMLGALSKPGRTVLGIDRESYSAEYLLVPSECIINTTLGNTVDLHRRFDLVLCLETAEHIAGDQAGCVVANCVRHSDVVLFSAAIPGQGGLNHVNEQPPEFWQRLFDEADYEVVDYIRPLIWDDASIPLWYRQNMLLFVNRKAQSTLDVLHAEEAKKASFPPLFQVHPSLFKWQAEQWASCTAQLRAAHVELEHLRAETQTANAALEKHRGELARITAEQAALQAESMAQREHSGRVLSKAWDLIHKMQGEREEESRRTETELTRLRTEREEEIKQLRAQLWTEREEEIKQLRAEFLSSTSWRVTAPLRWVRLSLSPRM